MMRTYNTYFLLTIIIKKKRRGYRKNRMMVAPRNALHTIGIILAATTI